MELSRIVVFEHDMSDIRVELILHSLGNFISIDLEDELRVRDLRNEFTEGATLSRKIRKLKMKRNSIKHNDYTGMSEEDIKTYLVPVLYRMFGADGPYESSACDECEAKLRLQKRIVALPQAIIHLVILLHVARIDGNRASKCIYQHLD